MSNKKENQSKNSDEILKDISKDKSFRNIAETIINEDFGDEIENLDINNRILSKILIINIKALCDKGMKTHAHMLSQEYFAQEDLDGDGLIYGLDWIYINPPKVLEHIIPNKNAKKYTFKPKR